MGWGSGLSSGMRAQGAEEKRGEKSRGHMQEQCYSNLVLAPREDPFMSTEIDDGQGQVPQGCVARILCSVWEAEGVR